MRTERHGARRDLQSSLDLALQQADVSQVTYIQFVLSVAHFPALPHTRYPLISAKVRALFVAGSQRPTTFLLPPAGCP